MLDGKVKLVRVSLEADKGTALLGATEIRAYDPEIKREDNDIEQENTATGLGGPDAFEPGPALGTGSLKTYLRSNGISSLDAGILAILQACGLKYAAGPPIALTIADEAAQKTITVDHWVGGLQKRLYAAAGNWQLTAEKGMPVEMQFDFKGKYTFVGSVVIPTAVPNVTPPMRAESMILTLADIGPAGGLKVNRLHVNANNQVQDREDLTATLGIGYYFIGSDRKYMVELDPEAELAANWDPWAIHEAGTTGAMQMVFSDGTVDMTIDIPALQLKRPDDGRRGTKLIYNLQGQCNPDSGDDEISITLAATV